MMEYIYKSPLWLDSLVFFLSQFKKNRMIKHVQISDLQTFSVTITEYFKLGLKHASYVFLL